MAGLNSARGVFPSVQGDIPISWATSASQFELSVDVPKSTKATALIPQRDGKNPRALSINGTLVFGDTKSPASSSVNAEANGLRLSLAEPGHFEIVAKY
jgi:hypothetical protein